MKRILSMILCVVIILSFATPALGVVEDDSIVIREPQIVSDVFIDPELVGTKLLNDIMPLDFYNEIPVVSDIFETKKLVYVTPTGQPSLGYVGGTGAFVFFFTTGGNSVKFTVTINAQNFTFTAETGSSTASGQGYGAPVPPSTGRYRFDFIKNYVITTKKVDVYQYTEYKYSYYLHDSEYSLSHRWVKL